MKVLLIEDNAEDTQLIKGALAKELDVPFTLEHATCLADGLRVLAAQPVDLVLVDLLLPDAEGLDAVARVQAMAPRVPTVVLTASDDEGLAVQALHIGAQDYLVKGLFQVYHNMLGRSIRYAIERKRADDELRKAQEQNEHLLASITSILIGVSGSGIITHWNAVAEATFGLAGSRFINYPLAECRIPWEQSKVTDGISVCRSSGRPTRVDDVSFTRPDGRTGLLGITIIPLRGEAGVLLFGADVTDRKAAEEDRLRLQERLVQAQKMETIGRFAGGIAHDFQNFLQVILGFAWLIRARHRDDRELMSDLQEIVHAAESASGMVRQLLAFSRRQALRPTIVEVNQMLRNMERLLQQFVGERITVELRLDPAPLMAKLDPTGLEQILINLASNARDSMQGQGTLTILTSRQSIDEAFVAQHPSAKIGEHVRLSIRDTGTGMDPEVAAHIFEPFFTTKQVGKGTGLGLAVVYGMVQQHDGLVDVETALGQGTTFHLYFPLQVFPAGPRAPAKPAAAPAAVLVVERNERQRAFTEEVLRESGYRVVGAVEDAAALDRLRADGQRVDLVVLDVTALGADGPDALQRIRALHPQTHILLVSSRMDESLRMLEASYSGAQILRKPYVPEQLLDGVRQLLDQPAPAIVAGGPGPAAAASSAAKPRVLIVDDDPSIRLFCERALQDVCKPTAVASSRAALERLERESYDFLLTDLIMPEMDGFALLDEVAKRYPALPLAVMSGSLTPEVEHRLETAPYHHCPVLRKPFTALLLQETVTQRR